MARFRYQMQSILDIKLKLETLAKQDFAAAKAALDREEEHLAGLYQRKAEYEQEAEQLRSGILNIREIADNRAAVERMQEFIDFQLIKVNVARNRLEEAREKLTEVMKERKTYETLKEKAFEAFIQEENRQESKEVDELTSYTYGQKRQVN